MADDDLLTTAEVAQIAGRSVWTVNRWVAERKLTIARKLPGTTGAHLFRRSEVEPVLAAEADERLAVAKAEIEKWSAVAAAAKSIKAAVAQRGNQGAA